MEVRTGLLMLTAQKLCVLTGGSQRAGVVLRPPRQSQTLVTDCSGVSRKLEGEENRLNDCGVTRWSLR